MQVVISSGHGKYIRGASGLIDEVDEARLVVEDVATSLRSMGVEVTTYHDDVSHSQNENLNRIVDFHNSRVRDMDVSVHFNAYLPQGETTADPKGCEVFYTSSNGEVIAKKVVNEICTASGLKNRGAKYTSSLFFLNNTNEPAVLIEVCFVDSQADVDIYGEMFTVICDAIACGISGEEVEPGPEPVPPTDDYLFQARGRCSSFGGPEDTGVSPSEGLAFIYEVDQAPQLFLPFQPSGTTGLARRLNPFVHYIACRWNYEVTPKDMLRDSGQRALVRANGWELLAFPADWGPHEDTARVADLSPGLMEALGLATDDEVEVIYPYEE